jgi:hypothetical protein
MTVDLGLWLGGTRAGEQEADMARRCEYWWSGVGYWRERRRGVQQGCSRVVVMCMFERR